MIESESLNTIENYLFVDIGNSNVKMKSFEVNKWNNVFQSNHNDLNSISESFRENPEIYERIIISSVVDSVTEKLESFFSPVPVQVLSINDIPPDTLNYDTPETLGIDRYLACLGAWKLSKAAVVVIDSGTACTIDYMAMDGVFQGGVIFPGLRIWENGLRTFAPALPAVEHKIPHIWPGKSTETSLQWGLSGAYWDVIESALKRYKTKFGDFDIWLTGGDSDDISRLLEQTAIIDKNLVFEGMKELIIH